MAALSLHSSSRTAIVQLLAGAAILGSNGLMVRFSGAGATASAFWRMLLAGLLLAALVQWRYGWQRLSFRTYAWLVLPALAFAMDLWLWHRSILIVGPGLATLLGNAQVFFMTLAAWALFGERLRPGFIGGVMLAFVGLWLLLGGDWNGFSNQYRWGIAFGLLTGLAYACFNISLKRAQAEAAQDLPRAPVEQVLCLAAFGSACCLALMAYAEGSSLVLSSWQSFAWLFVLAAFGHCLSWVLISKAMAQLSVALVGLLLLLQPMVAYLLDVLVLDLSISPRQWLGLAVTLMGIFLASLRKPKPARPAQAA